MTSIAQPQLGPAEYEAVGEVLESGMLADGPKVREFESAFADFCDGKHAVATSNGTTALHTALVALGIGQGDRVLTTPFSFAATANSIVHAGATPVFADIEPDTFNLDPAIVEEIVREEDIRAIVVVHLYGLPAKMDEFTDIAEEHDLVLVEDAAQAHGAKHRGNPVGSIGDVGCFSFYPTKNMTCGEGGMIVTDDADVADVASRFVNHGRTGQYIHETVGHNFRMTSIAAAIGFEQLGRLPEFVSTRRRNAAMLTEGLDHIDQVTPPREPDYARHAYHQYTIRADDRGGLAAALEAAGIGSGVYYPSCIHTQPAFGGHHRAVPEAERAAEEVLSVPVHPSVTESEVEEINAVISNYAN